MALIALIPVSELAISLLNLIITSQVPPAPAAQAGDARGHSRARSARWSSSRRSWIPPSALGSLLDDLEVRFLANRDPNLHFALLSDFADASSRSQPGDEALVAAATHAGRRAQRAARRRSVLPVSPRAALESVRAALDGMGAQTRQAGGVQPAAARRDRHQLRRAPRRHRRILPSVRYVITLDSDTQLPMEAARRLVGTLSHPLNRPRFDPRLQRVTEGYGVLQPRVAVSTGQRQPHDVRAGLLRARRRRSVHNRRVGRLSGPVSRRQLRRQGHLRRRRVRSGAGRTGCRKTRCSATISSRDPTPAPGCAPTSIWSTTTRRTT